MKRRLPLLARGTRPKCAKTELSVAPVLVLVLVFLCITVAERGGIERPVHLQLGDAADYQWISKEDQRTANWLWWVDAEQRPYDGFPLERGFITEVSDPSGLRHSGGFWGPSTSLAVVGADGGFFISTSAQLAKAFSPVQSAQQAISFVFAQIPCVLTGDEGRIVARTAQPTRDEFWVQLALRQCGCTWSPSLDAYGGVFAVSRRGEVRRLAFAALHFK